MLTVVLGNSKLSFAITDCISQGSLAENRIHSSWFKLREIYYRVLNGLQNLLGMQRNRIQIELSGVPSRASWQSRPPSNYTKGHVRGARDIYQKDSVAHEVCWI